MRRRRRPGVRLLLAVVAVSAVAGLQVASASSLNVGAGIMSTATASHPCPGPATVTASGSGASAAAVKVDVPVGCAERGVSVVVLSGTTVVAGGSGTVAATGATTVATGAYTPAPGLTAQVVLDGWTTPATWSYAPPAAITCYPVDPTVTATCTAVVTRWDFWGSGYRVDFTVTTPSATSFEWEVALDLSATGQAAPGGGTLFPGYPVPAAQWWSSWTPTHFSGSNVCADSRAGELPVVRLRGSAGWSSMVSASAPVQSLGFQANQNGSGTINSLGCR